MLMWWLRTSAELGAEWIMPVSMQEVSFLQL